MLCATCHAPYRAFQDARARAFGLADADRNTISLLNVRYQRWFGWDGAGDSLWAQSIRPILEPREMGGSTAQVAALVRGDAGLACRYQKAFGAPLPAADEAVLAGVGKALAAYQETLVTGRAPFDDFRDALARGDAQAIARYPAAALRGLRIFIGRGNCASCHSGPSFSNGEFRDSGADPGRQGGIRKLLANPYNALGAYNDDSSGASATRTRQLMLERHGPGELRVPMLRNVAQTAPYMHDGSVTTLAEAARHYPEAGKGKMPRLTDGEVEDLVAFLESLTETKSALPSPQAAAPCP